MSRNECESQLGYKLLEVMSGEKVNFPIFRFLNGLIWFSLCYSILLLAGEPVQSGSF